MLTLEEISNHLDEISDLLQKFYECIFASLEGKNHDNTPQNLMQQIVDIRNNVQQSIYECM